MKVTREQILAKAREHFARFGFRKTSLAGIAGELGVVKGALYYHVPGGKREMADACMRAIEDEFYEAMRRASDDERDPANALRAAIRAKLTVIAGLRERIGLSEQVGEEIKVMMASQEREYHDREVHLFEKILAWGEREGEFRSFASREAVARVIQAIVRHFELADAFAGSEDERTGELTLELILGGLRAR